MSLKHLLTVLALVLGSFYVGGNLSGCNTTEGFGEDVEAAGEGIQSGAEDMSD